MKTLIAACCICIALSEQCLADQTLFTCTDAAGYSYTTEGGQNKPGWEQKTFLPSVIKLIRIQDAAKAGGFFDIQVTTNSGVYSYLKDASCHIDEMSMSDVINLDQAFLINCKSFLLTYLFYTRSGVAQVLTTYLSLEHAYTGAGVSVSKPCKTGD
jgi:hypothetical protein